MIDVSKCEFYLNGDCTLIDNCLGAKYPFLDKTNPYCSCYEDCYYKQLQQLKQENDKLKKAFDSNTLNYILDLEKRLEKIKEFIENFGAMADDADCVLPMGILKIIEE